MSEIRVLFSRIGNAVVFIGVVVLTACGGGNDSDPCYSLKIAGGNECENRPSAVVAITTDGRLCSGAFVTTRHVLTAAHCIPDGGGSVTVETAEGPFSSTQITIHPRYRPNELSPYDVAIVELEQDINVVPAPLVASDSVERGDKLIAYGYGLDENGEVAPGRVARDRSPLKATYLDVSAVDDEYIRTISDGGGDTCSGDSGGPIVFEPDNSDEFGLVAVVSFGPSICVVDSGLPSANANLQSESVREFILTQAPAVRFN